MYTYDWLESQHEDSGLTAQPVPVLPPPSLPPLSLQVPPSALPSPPATSLPGPVWPRLGRV